MAVSSSDLEPHHHGTERLMLETFWCKKAEELASELFVGDVTDQSDKETA
jgi:hypothetical protein